MNRPGRRVGPWDHLVGFALAASYLGLLFSTAPDLAMSRDESFYVVAAEQMAPWFEQLADAPERAMERPSVDRHFGYNHEHPSLAKGLFALSWLAHQRYDLFPDASTAHRFPAMVLSSLLLWLIYIFGARAFGRPAGAFAAVAFALLPRVFYQAHLNAFDMPIVFMTTLVIYCYWRSLKSRFFGLLVGVAFGLALETKHNSWLLPFIFAIHFIWMALAEVAYRRRSGSKRMSLFPYWLVSMGVLGPLIFVGLWPWLWYDTVPRIEEYASFHLNHVYYNMAYFGVNYFRPPFPVSFPFVMTLFTVPLTVLALGFVGLWHRLPAIVPGPLAARLFPGARDAADRYRTDVLMVGCLLAPIVVIALPTSPIFGGTKHWMPAYPFLCLYAGLGYWKVVRSLRALVKENLPAARHSVRALSACLLLAPSMLETIHSHPFGLSHYTYAAGFTPGAADYGMNRQFWGFTTGSLVPFFREHLPNGGTVWLCDTTPMAFDMLVRDGALPANIRPARAMHQADYVLVHHEHHFAEVDYQAWVAFGSVRPAYVLTHDGVPIITVYQNPRSPRVRP
jgi:hypothetical protein